MQVARVNTDGSLDSSFGSGGFSGAVVFPLESGNLALQPDGKILVAAGVDNPNGVPSEMARFTASGRRIRTSAAAVSSTWRIQGRPKSRCNPAARSWSRPAWLRDLYSRRNPPHSPVPSLATTPTAQWTRLLVPPERRPRWPRPRLWCCKATAKSWSPVRSPARSVRLRQSTMSASGSLAIAPTASSMAVSVPGELLL